MKHVLTSLALVLGVSEVYTSPLIHWHRPPPRLKHCYWSPADLLMCYAAGTKSEVRNGT